MTRQEKATLQSWLQLCRDTERHYQFLLDNHLPGIFGNEITQADVNEMSAKRFMIESICAELNIKEA